MWPQTGFDRPCRPGFELFNTRKTLSVIKVVLPRRENTGGTVGERKMTEEASLETAYSVLL